MQSVGKLLSRIPLAQQLGLIDDGDDGGWSPRDQELFMTPALAAAQGIGGHWEKVPGAQSRLKDPGYCERATARYQDGFKNTYSNGFEKLVTSPEDRVLYMTLEWSDDVYTTQNQLSLVGTAVDKVLQWKREIKSLRRMDSVLSTIVGLSGTLTPAIVGISSSVFPELKELKNFSDVRVGVPGTGCRNSATVWCCVTLRNSPPECAYTCAVDRDWIKHHWHLVCHYTCAIQVLSAGGYH
jgi:hypothetical protein|eukprot:COSAG01_NODE_10002_length_2277_cov_1.846648_1_plen_239_part_00